MADKVAVFTTAWLVWVESPLGPRPQVWFEDAGRCVGPSNLVVLARHKLPLGADSYLTLESLAELYPFTEAQEAA